MFGLLLQVLNLASIFVEPPLELLRHLAFRGGVGIAQQGFYAVVGREDKELFILPEDV
jgi:hypothetical protein